MTATDTECMTLYLRLSVSQLTGLPAVVFELWQRGQQVYYARQNVRANRAVEAEGRNGAELSE